MLGMDFQDSSSIVSVHEYVSLCVTWLHTRKKGNLIKNIKE